MEHQYSPEMNIKCMRRREIERKGKLRSVYVASRADGVRADGMVIQEFMNSIKEPHCKKETPSDAGAT